MAVIIGLVAILVNKDKGREIVGSLPAETEALGLRLSRIDGDQFPDLRIKSGFCIECSLDQGQIA